MLPLDAQQPVSLAMRIWHVQLTTTHRHCRALIVGGLEARRLGLALLVHFTPQLLLPLPGQAPLLGMPEEWLVEEGPQAQEQPLWWLLRDCLVTMGRVAGPSTIADGLHLDATWQQRLCSVRVAPLSLTPTNTHPFSPARLHLACSWTARHSTASAQHTCSRRRCAAAACRAAGSWRSRGPPISGCSTTWKTSLFTCCRCVDPPCPPQAPRLLPRSRARPAANGKQGTEKGPALPPS